MRGRRPAGRSSSGRSPPPQVHDELLIECPAHEAEKVAATLKREMENAVELDVPLIAETGIGDNWMDAKH